MIIELGSVNAALSCSLHLADDPGEFITSQFSIKKLKGLLELQVVQLSECTLIYVDHGFERQTLLTARNEASGLVLVFAVPDDLPANLSSYLLNPLRPRELTVQLQTVLSEARQILRAEEKLLMLWYSDAYSHSAGQLLEGMQKKMGTNSAGQACFEFLLDSRMLTVLSELLSGRSAEEHWQFYADSKSRELFSHLLREADLQAKSLSPIAAEEINKLETVKSLIDTKIDAPASVDHLARAVGYSPARLRKNFKTHFGLSIHQYVLKVRMQKALELLHHSGETINSISITLGFKNLSNFSAAFKKYFGKSPKLLRTKN